MSAANTDLAPPAGAVMIVTVPALTALESGNVHRVVSGGMTAVGSLRAAEPRAWAGRPHHVTRNWPHQRRAQSSSHIPYTSPLLGRIQWLDAVASCCNRFRASAEPNL